MERADGRLPSQLRPTQILLGCQEFADGSALVEIGKTKVLCAASVEDRVPPFLRGTNRGWITAEYSLLPRSTLTRTQRESVAGRQSGRTHEIQRLIGRSLRAIANLDQIPGRTLIVDCDVLQADGGTRAASITGSYVALYQAFQNLIKRGIIRAMPLHCAVAAVSAGVLENEVLVDLCYEEDSHASVDFNLVMTDTGRFVEIQGTAEGAPFSDDIMTTLFTRAKESLDQLFQAQTKALQELL